MRVSEIDFRISWVDSVYSGLKKAESSIRSAVDDDVEMEWFDVGEGIEHLEEVYGVAFVVAQVYLNSEYNELKHKWRYVLPSKKSAFQGFSVKIKGFDVAEAELLYALGNYYKHQEEWKDWKPEGDKKDTITTLGKIGIDEKSDSPLFDAANIFSPNAHDVFGIIRESLCMWRKKLIEKASTDLPI